MPERLIHLRSAAPYKNGCSARNSPSFSNLEDFWDDLHVSRLKYNALDDFLDFLEVLNQMVFIFHSFKDLEDFWDDLSVSRLKYNALDDFQEVFQTTFRKSSGLPGSLLDFLEVF
ncbi:hypothetical protein YC2023_011126 [Brassica napus]